MIIPTIILAPSIAIKYWEAETPRSGWSSDWNYSDRPIYWGEEWEYDSNGNPYPLI